MSLIMNNVGCGACGGGAGGSSGGGVSNHEQLSGLMGGNTNGHYHVDATQFERLTNLLSDEKYQKLLELLDEDNEFIYDGGAAGTPASEYKYYLEGGSSNDDDGTVIGGGGA